MTDALFSGVVRVDATTTMRQCRNLGRIMRVRLQGVRSLAA